MKALPRYLAALIAIAATIQLTQPSPGLASTKQGFTKPYIEDGDVKLLEQVAWLYGELKDSRKLLDFLVLGKLPAERKPLEPIMKVFTAPQKLPEAKIRGTELILIASDGEAISFRTAAPIHGQFLVAEKNWDYGEDKPWKTRIESLKKILPQKNPPTNVLLPSLLALGELSRQIATTQVCNKGLKGVSCADSDTRLLQTVWSILSDSLFMMKTKRLACLRAVTCPQEGTSSLRLNFQLPDDRALVVTIPPLKNNSTKATLSGLSGAKVTVERELKSREDDRLIQMVKALGSRCADPDRKKNLATLPINCTGTL